MEYRMLLQSLSKENDIGGASVDSDAQPRLLSGRVPNGNYEFKGANSLNTLTTLLMGRVAAVFSLKTIQVISVPCMLNVLRVPLLGLVTTDAIKFFHVSTFRQFSPIRRALDLLQPIRSIVVHSIAREKMFDALQQLGLTSYCYQNVKQYGPLEQTT